MNKQVKVKNNDNIDNLRPNRTRSDRSTDREIRISLGATRGIDCPRIARMNTETRNISADQSNQWEYMSQILDNMLQFLPSVFIM